MLDRRDLLTLGVASAVATIASVSPNALATVGLQVGQTTSDQYPTRLLLVHGRGQRGQNADDLKSVWINTLSGTAQRLGRALPGRLEVVFPFYGDTLDEFTRQFEVPLTTDIQTKGSPVDDEFLRFQAEIAEALRRRAGITDSQVDDEYGSNAKPKGPQNWEWVQAIFRALDRHADGISQAALETFTRDVFLYTTRAGVRAEIDSIVAKSLTEDPTIVVGHSLGTVVAYSILRSDPRSLRVPLFVTLGAPLGIRAIREQFRPLRFPEAVEAWYNAFDDRDVVALYPLDADNFPVTPAIDNYGSVNNQTENRHGISGYLDDTTVTKRILDSMGA